MSASRLIVGDCREELVKLPGKSVQMCVTSPPYYKLRDYGISGQLGMEPTLDEYIANQVEMLYGAAWRAARALGYRSCITYTLEAESGTSLKAAGWRLIGKAGGGSWSRKHRPRVDTHPMQAKLRWEVQ